MEEMIAAALLSVAVQCNAESGSTAVSSLAADYLAALGSLVFPSYIVLAPCCKSISRSEAMVKSC